MSENWDPTQSGSGSGSKFWGVLVVVLFVAVVVILLIIGMAVIKRLEPKSKASPLSHSSTASRRVVNLGVEPTRGKDDAVVKIIAFEDFECPYCKQVEPILQRILGTYGTKIQLIYADFPLTEVHTHAFAAAVAGECAFAQGKFWEFHDLLYPNQDKLEQQDLSRYAQQAQLNMQKFQDCQKTQKPVSAVYADIHEAKRLGLTGTPTFYVNGIEFAGVLTYEQFQKVIDAELQRVGQE